MLQNMNILKLVNTTKVGTTFMQQRIFVPIKCKCANTSYT